MHICTVNGRRLEVPASLKTWGQLLLSLESTEGSAREVVTAVRFRGVDEPSFRTPSKLASDLRTLSPVEIDTATLPDLIAAGAAAIIEAIEPLTESARRTADAFRRHDLARANRGLAEFVGTFRTLTELTGTLQQLAPEQVGLDGAAGRAIERLNNSLESLIASDMSEDWLAVANLLENDIAGTMPDWAELLRHFNCEPIAMRRAS